MATISDIKRLLDEGEYLKAGEAAIKAAGEAAGGLYERSQESGLEVGTGGAPPKIGERVIEVVTSGDVDLPTALKTAADMLGDVDLPFGGADVRDDVLAREDIDQEERDLIEFLADESPGAAKRHDLYEHLRVLREEPVDVLSERLGEVNPRLTKFTTVGALEDMRRERAEARRAQALSTGTKALVRREGPGPRQPDDRAIAALAQEDIDDLILAELVDEGMEKAARIHTKMIADFSELRADGKFGDMHRELMGDLWSNDERPLLAEDIRYKETLKFLKANPKITKAYNAAGLFKETSKRRERSPFEGVTRPLPSVARETEKSEFGDFPYTLPGG